MKVDDVHLKDPVQEDLREAPQCVGRAGVPNIARTMLKAAQFFTDILLIWEQFFR